MKSLDDVNRWIIIGTVKIALLMAGLSLAAEFLVGCGEIDAGASVEVGEFGVDAPT